MQAICSCGWRSPVYGADKAAGTMDPLQRAADAGDLHEWEMSPRSGAVSQAVTSQNLATDGPLIVVRKSPWSDEFADRRWMAVHRFRR